MLLHSLIAAKAAAVRLVLEGVLGVLPRVRDRVHRPEPPLPAQIVNDPNLPLVAPEHQLLQEPVGVLGVLVGRVP